MTKLQITTQNDPECAIHTNSVDNMPQLLREGRLSSAATPPPCMAFGFGEKFDPVLKDKVDCLDHPGGTGRPVSSFLKIANCT